MLGVQASKRRFPKACAPRDYAKHATEGKTRCICTICASPPRSIWCALTTGWQHKSKADPHVAHDHSRALGSCSNAKHHDVWTCRPIWATESSLVTQAETAPIVVPRAVAGTSGTLNQQNNDKEQRPDGAARDQQSGHHALFHLVVFLCLHNRTLLVFLCPHNRPFLVHCPLSSTAVPASSIHP